MPRRNHKCLLSLPELQRQHLQIKIRLDQVKLRQLEWGTPKRALPHITPLPGDTAAQIRKAPVPQPSLMERYESGDPDLDPKMADLVRRAKEKLAQRDHIVPCPPN